MNYSCSLFDKMDELNSPELIYEKFGLYEDSDMDKCKKAFLYVFGCKIKKKKIMEILKNSNKELNICRFLSVEEFKIVFYHFKNEQHFVSNHELVMNFYKNLIGKEENNLNFNVFYSKIKEFFPSLSNTYLQEIFLSIDKDKDGIIRLSDLESYLF
jgi:hypothetical protein